MKERIAFISCNKCDKKISLDSYLKLQVVHCKNCDTYIRIDQTDNSRKSTPLWENLIPSAKKAIKTEASKYSESKAIEDIKTHLNTLFPNVWFYINVIPSEEKGTLEVYIEESTDIEKYASSATYPFIYNNYDGAKWVDKDLYVSHQKRLIETYSQKHITKLAGGKVRKELSMGDKNTLSLDESIRYSVRAKALTKTAIKNIIAKIKLK